MENKKRLFQLLGVWPMFAIIVIVLGGSAIMSEKGMLNDNQILIIINVGLFAALFNLFFWLWKLKPYDESCKCKAVNEYFDVRPKTYKAIYFDKLPDFISHAEPVDA